MRIRDVVIVTTLCLVASAPCSASIWTGSGTNPETDGNSVSAWVEFSLSGSVLTLELQNTTAGGTLAQGDALTGIVVSIAEPIPTIEMSSIDLTVGSAIWTSGTTSNTSDSIEGSWTDVLESGSSFALGTATTGFGGAFNGGSIDLGNASPDYGIVSAATFPGSIDGSRFPFVQDSLTFTFDVTGALDLQQITDVKFFFGTDGSGVVDGEEDGKTSTNEVVPEPASLAMWSVFLSLGAVMQLRRLRKRR